MATRGEAGYFSISNTFLEGKLHIFLMIAVVSRGEVTILRILQMATRGEASYHDIIIHLNSIIFVMRL